MSGGEGRNISCEDIQYAQIRIKSCLQQYMKKEEVLNALYHQDKIEPNFTELVWQKLEEENQEFFKAYYLKLMVKEQIIEFNKLLSEQVKLMCQIGTGVTSIPMSNGSHMSPSPSSTFGNCRPPIQRSLQSAVDMSSHGRHINACSNVLTQSSNVGMPDAVNVAATVGNSQFNFDGHRNYVESRSVRGDASVSSFSSVESNSQPLNETLLDADSSTFGFLGQISQNFSLTDLPADFSSNSDILESYSRTPFLAADGNFLDPHGDIARLDAIPEDLRYEDFGGD